MASYFHVTHYHDQLTSSHLEQLLQATSKHFNKNVEYALTFTQKVQILPISADSRVYYLKFKKMLKFVLCKMYSHHLSLLS